MKTFSRQLGRTELVVSRVGLGLAAVGRPAYITLGRATDLGADRGVDTMREGRQLAESKGFLNGRLQLYQIHSATLESGVLQDRAVLTELRRIKDTGLAIGLTVTCPHQSATIDCALAIDVFDAGLSRSIRSAATCRLWMYR